MSIPVKTILFASLLLSAGIEAAPHRLANGHGHHEAAVSASATANATVSSTGYWQPTAVTSSTSSVATSSGTTTAARSVSSSSLSSAPHWVSMFFVPMRTAFTDDLLLIVTNQVIYADEWLNTMPSVSDLEGYNRFILAFWMSTSGAVDVSACPWAVVSLCQ